MNIEIFEDFLKSNLPVVKSFHPHYEKALQEMLFCGGKRFRPYLLLSVVEFYEPLLIKPSLDIALSVEYLHTYSLIHDDLPAMDNASIRRGKATLHKTYNEALAILVGDGLNSEAFYKISKSTLRDDVKIKLVETLSQNGGISAMVLGQAIDLEFENKKLTLEQLENLHLNKTAKLIAGSLKMGAIIVNLPLVEQDKIYNMGIELGILFQIQDDILDVVSDSSELGKDTNQDEDKNSFVTLLGLEEAIKKANKKVDEVIEILDSFDKDFCKYMQKRLSKYLHRHLK